VRRGERTTSRKRGTGDGRGVGRGKEVRSGTARFRVAIQADSTKRALGLVAGRHPASTCRAKFPMEAEVFSGEGFAARAGMVELPEKLAA